MGMFDYIYFEDTCPVCGYKMDDFQSKDADNCLEILPPHQVENFHTFCNKCKTWFDYKVNKLTIYRLYTHNNAPIRDIIPYGKKKKDKYRNKDKSTKA